MNVGLQRLWVTLILGVTFCACSTTPDRNVSINAINEGSEPAIRVDSPSTQARLNNVGFLTPGLNRYVGVQQTGAKRTATNTLEVYAVFRNRTERDVSIQVRTQYFGTGSEPYEGPFEWQSVFLPPNSIQTYRTYSRGTEASYYYIEAQVHP